MRAKYLFSLLLISLILPVTMQGEKPFDFASTPGKLPKQVVPTDYSIRIIPNIDKLTFTGTETVKLDVRSPVRELVLNVSEIEIANASIDDKPIEKSAVKIDNKSELLRIALPAELSAGKHALSLTFSGKINEFGRGLFFAHYQEHGTGAKKTMLGTQFEATDARRFFPCWDEPVFRARFQLTAVVPENWNAFSNMPVEHEGKSDGGKELRFAATPPMSSYLNVFVAGELDVIESNKSGVQIRVVTTKGKSEWGRYALESTEKVLQYYNEYFGEPYPLPKLDQLAIPGGFGGAMENWGGITYFESVLLFDPEKSSDNTKHDIFSVIAHEVAHMWFGDLVTMAWWDNLWLNEGFASWMGTKSTAHFNPQWEVWLRRNIPRDPARRSGIAKEQAMEGDARSTTHPIQQPIATEAEANSAFDDITYKKGQSFIRMLESFLGEDVFRDGIRRYIAAHKYSNSTTADLWKSLADASGKPVLDIATGWTQQPGFPVVKVQRGDGGKVTLTQERFTVHFPKPPALQWKIPLTYAVVGQAPGSLLMTSKIENLQDIPSDKALKLNVEGTGNYRVQYDERSWGLLLSSLGALKMEDRVNLLCDTWALVQADRAKLSVYLDLIDKLPPENQMAESEQIINAFAFVEGLLAGHPAQEKFRTYARSVLQPRFNKLGWDPKPGESPNDGNLRASLVAGLGDLNDSDIAAGCRTRFQQYLNNPASLPPDLRRAVFGVVGHYADKPTWDMLHEFGLKTTSIEEKQNYYDALAGVLDSQLAQKALAISLTDELPTSRALAMVSKVARVGGHADLACQFAKANIKALLKKTDALGANTYMPGLFTLFSDKARAEELKAYAKANLPPDSAKEVAKAVDEVEFRAEFKPRLAQQFGEWIDQQAAKK